MNITFYNNSSEEKKVDKVLTNATTISGDPVTPIDMINPTVRIAYASFPHFNYAYIADFARYYYVTKKTCSVEGMWDVSLTEDTLMSWKAEIRANTAFVLRNQYTYNSKLVNNTIAKNTNRLITTETSATPIIYQVGGYYPWTSYSSYISSGSTSPHFILVLSPAVIQSALIPIQRPPKHGLLYSITGPLGQQVLNAEFEVAQILEKGLSLSDFIHEFYYFPIMPQSQHMTALTQISFKKSWLDMLSQNNFISDLFELNYAPQTNPFYYMGNEDDYIVKSRWVIPLTDNSPSNAKFLNASPFTKFILHFLPFPDVQLDPSMFMTSTGTYYPGIGVEVTADFRTGHAVLSVATGNPASVSGDFGSLMAVASTNIKIELPVFSLADNVAGAGGALRNLQSLSTSSADPVTVQTSGGEELTIPDMTPYIAAAKLGWDVANVGYTTTIKGTAGSMIMDNAPSLRVEYNEYTSASPSTLALPLNEERQLSTLSGLTICGSVHLDGLSAALPSEMEDIEKHLKSGVIL